MPTVRSTIEARNTAFVSAARQVGITIEAALKATNYMYDNYDNNFAPQNKDKWAMQDAGPDQPRRIPHRRADLGHRRCIQRRALLQRGGGRLMTDSVTARTLTRSPRRPPSSARTCPVLFMPNPANIVVWKTELSGDPDAFANLTQGFQTPEYWYYTAD